MKEQVTGPFKSFFLSPKKAISPRALHEFLFALPQKCAVVPTFPILKSTLPFSAAPSFSNNVSTLRSGLINGKHTADYHPSPSEFQNPSFQGYLWVGLSRIFLEFFLRPVYPIMVAEKFQNHGVKITEKYIYESKNWVC